MSRDLTDALDSLSRRERHRPKSPPAPRGKSPRQISAAEPAVNVNSGSGTIGGDLVEQDISRREYYDAHWRSSDGLFLFPAIKKVVMTNADDELVTLTFAAP